jgi:hypothetical protein
MINVNIDSTGTARFIWNDDLAGLLEHGDARVVRASHVEPDDRGGWLADMSPSGGPVLGPFKLRAEALVAEVGWLRTNRGL